MVDLGHYGPAHRAELEKLLDSAAWREVLASGLLEEVKAEKVEPGTRRDFIDTVADQLLELNEERVEKLIAGGNEDEEFLLDEIGKWPERLDEKELKISFLGFNVTADCNFLPRCVYCNQPFIQDEIGLDGWKRIVEEVTRVNEGNGPYIYITGGEPLMLEEEIWGDDGLIQFATRRGASVNVNTNALMLTPEVALRFVKTGLSRLHISLDTANEALQNFLLGGDRMGDVLEGIYNVQLARDLAGVEYPEVHTNCVLTKKNLEHFPDLFRFILEKRKLTVDRKDPLYQDLFPHVIPVGGRSNDSLRPSADEFKRFYEGIWPAVCRIWDEYQEEMGVSEEERGRLFGYFSNPFLRVEHEGGLEAYVQTSAEGKYGRLALPRYCYVAPTQGSFTPDGYQYRCGSHAIRRILPIGKAGEGSFFENIRTGIAGLDGLPQEEDCYGCALATLYINQAVEGKLRERLKEMREAVAAG